MFEILIGLAIVLAIWDRLFWILSLCFPSVTLFQRLQLPRWKWPRK